MASIYRWKEHPVPPGYSVNTYNWSIRQMFREDTRMSCSLILQSACRYQGLTALAARDEMLASHPIIWCDVFVSYG